MPMSGKWMNKIQVFMMKHWSFIIIAFFALSCIQRQISDIEPSDLKCDYSVHPLAVENHNPGLSWILNSDKRNQKQTAYQILVASSEEILSRNIGDLWDSEKVESDESIHIMYNGKPLSSGLRCWWKVRVWDKGNKKSEWSKPGYWEMGLIDPDDWKAHWISYDCRTAPLFRKDFKVTKELKEARIYISGLGYYELHINGKKTGDHVLDPAQTDYEQRCFYVVYDVTGQVVSGDNTIGIILGNGWYNQAAVNHGRYGWKDIVYGKPRLIFQMRLIFSDGSERYILSDDTWKGSPGPIISDNVYAGEIYDSRLEREGWDKPGYDDAGWDNVTITDGPGGKLISQKLPPIKKMQTIKPVELTNPKPGIYVYDMGQNFAGWAKLKLKASEGTEIKLRFAESTFPDGMIDPASTGVYATDVIQTDKYIFSGKENEEWEPRFTYHGFRYVEMTGFPGKPGLENIEGVFVHSDVGRTGEFLSSDTMINKLHQTALWTELSNMHGIPTDCPHRERCGWLGDAFLTSDMTMYNFDVALFWTKFICDIETSRHGDVPPNIAPGRRYGGSDPDWGAAFIQLPWNLFLYYGDTSIIREHYSGMSFFMNYLDSMAIDNIVYAGIGSLFSPGRIRARETPVEFTSTLLYYFCADVMSRMALIIGKDEDAARYLNRAHDIKTSFNSMFYSRESKSYGNQEKNCLALAFRIVPDSDKADVARNLNDYVMGKDKGHITTGIFGTRYIYETLARYGYSESVQDLFNKTGFPGYKYLFSRGATTFWEHWGESKFEDNVKPGDDRSRNHPFQGGFDAWFYNGIAGIIPDPEHPGFKHFFLKPQIVKGMDYANTQFKSIHGIIKSEWHNDDGNLIWKISVPVNTTATSYFPTRNIDAISEFGKAVSFIEGVNYSGSENGNSIFKIGSGNYEFVINK